jgi:hypothetical protein
LLKFVAKRATSPPPGKVRTDSGLPACLSVRQPFFRHRLNVGHMSVDAGSPLHSWPRTLSRSSWLPRLPWKKAALAPKKLASAEKNLSM